MSATLIPAVPAATDAWGMHGFAEKELARLKRGQAERWFEEGPPVAAGVRLLLHSGAGTHLADERLAHRLRDMVAPKGFDRRQATATLREQIKRQACLLLLDRDRAVAALPRLLPDRQARIDALGFVRDLLATTGRADAAAQTRFDAVVRDLGLDRDDVPPLAADAAAPARAKRRGRTDALPAASPAASPAAKAPRVTTATARKTTATALRSTRRSTRPGAA